MNPTAGHELHDLAIHRSGQRRVLVVGGGPAGMEAARTAAEQGDSVVLCEATGRLGGQLEIARTAPHRAEMGEIVDWLAAEIAALGVDVRLDTTVTADYVRLAHVDKVIIAAGSVPRTDGFQIADPAHPVRGVELAHVFTSWELLAGADIPGTRAVVFDDIGHHEAVSAVDALLALGRSVTLVSRLNRLAPLLESARLETTIKLRLSPADFEFLGDSRLGSIEAGKVAVVSIYGGPDRVIPADAVILVGPNIPQRSLADELGDHPSVELVGDALGPRFLQLAMTEAHRSALRD